MSRINTASRLAQDGRAGLAGQAGQAGQSAPGDGYRQVDEQIRLLDGLGKPQEAHFPAYRSGHGTGDPSGQHDTYLNVRGGGSVARSIARCWQSLYAPAPSSIAASAA